MYDNSYKHLIYTMYSLTLWFPLLGTHPVEIRTPTLGEDICIMMFIEALFIVEKMETKWSNKLWPI